MARKLLYLILHCTATPEGVAVTSETIRRWHTSPKPVGRGWKQVGYSDMIHLDGEIENLAPYDADDEVDPWEITNGAAGINSVSRHVVYVGGVAKDAKTPKDTRTDSQKTSLEAYVKSKIKQHPNIKIGGHNQFAAKACPSFDVPAWCRSIGIPAKNIIQK